MGGRINIRNIVAAGSILIIVVSILAVFAICDPDALVEPPGFDLEGEGTKDAPYLVTSAKDLAYLRDAVNSGRTNEGSCFVQTNDIDLSAYSNWQSIGDETTPYSFNCNYDGMGHCIYNLSYSGSGGFGLFGRLGGTVQNLGIGSGEIECDNGAALVRCGTESSKIINCFNNAHVEGRYHVGGIVDETWGVVLLCANAGDISSQSGVSGGVVGYDARIVANCVSAGSGVTSNTFSGMDFESSGVILEEADPTCFINYSDLGKLLSLQDVKGQISSLDGCDLSGLVQIRVNDDRSGFAFGERTVATMSRNILDAGLYEIPLFAFFATAILLAACAVRRGEPIWLAASTETTLLGEALADGESETASGRNEVKASAKAQLPIGVQAVSVAIVCTIVVVGGIACNKVLAIGNTLDGDSVAVGDYYDQPKDTVDVLFVGTSRAGTNLDPEALWRDFGIPSYDMWVNMQDFWGAYYCICEAAKTNRPKVVVLDVRAAAHTNEYSGESVQYQNTAGMRLSGSKLRLIQASAPQERWLDLLLGFPISHMRYGELSAHDFYSGVIVRGASNKGTCAQTAQVRYGSNPSLTIDDASTVQGISPMREKQERYLRAITQKCKNEGILLLLVATPLPNSISSQPYFNDVQRIAEEEGVPFLNCNLMLDDIGVDALDFLPENVGAHMNVSGARKVTAFLANYLIENYGLVDRRGNEYYSSWDDYAHNFENGYLGVITGQGDYLTELLRDGRQVMVINQGLYFTNQQLITAKRLASEVDFNLSGIGVSSSFGCWMIQDTSSSTDMEPIGSDSGVYTTCMGEHSIEARLSSTGILSIDSNKYPIPASSLTFVIYDDYTGEIVDICTLVQPSDTVTHQAVK